MADGSRRRLRRSRAWPAVALSAIAIGVSGCSFLIDVEPDCAEVADCAPYVCNAANTACLSGCATDFDCAPGFVCDERSTRCVSQGCVPTGLPVSVFSLGGSGLEYDATRVDQSFWVLAASSEVVGVIELTADGEVVGGGDGLIALDLDPSPPVAPVAVGGGDGLTVFWRGSAGQNLQDIRTFHVSEDGEPRGPSVVYEGRRAQNLDNPDAVLFGNGVVVGWSTFIDRIQVQLLPLNVDGTYGLDRLETAPNSAAIVATADNTGSSLPALAATADRAVLVRRETVGNNNNVVVSFLDSGFEPINDHIVSDMPGQGIDRMRAAGMADAVAAAWLETIDDEVRLMRAVDDVNGTIQVGVPTEVGTTSPPDLTVPAGSTEFGILWVADGAQGRDVFMRRFDETGDPLFVTFSATSKLAENPSRPDLVRTSDGYATFWVESDFEPPELFFRRYVCAR